MLVLETLVFPISTQVNAPQAAEALDFLTSRS